ncbi:SAM-dependent methyltransferase [Streptomyces sp. NPDC059785]|uniref:SAM-dependent methyltransferase n=1 Tax=Streptomyces sp. NPDC059785 TaxID=3346945 RepID=UPI00364AD81D
MPLVDVADVASPSLARMHNFLLGGRDHYPADRSACERLLQIAPDARRVAETGHRFLLRATSRLVREHRVRQFVVFGAGLPTPAGVHQVAQEIDAVSRVVYAEDDPLAVTHDRAVREDRRRTLVVQAAPGRAAQVLPGPAARNLIDIGLPVAVLFVSVLHTLPDPAGVLQETASVLAPGSFLAASQLVSPPASWSARTPGCGSTPASCSGRRPAAVRDGFAPAAKSQRPSARCR